MTSITDNRQVIQEFLSNQLGQEVVLHDDQVLTELGVDSIMMLELIFEFEEKLDIKFPDDLPEPKTVGELMIVVNELHQTAIAKQ